MSKRNIAEEIVKGLEEIKAWKRGELKLKTYSVEMPKAANVPGIRKELGLSQPEFAGFMGVSLGTLRNWEQERREPQDQRAHCFWSPQSSLLRCSRPWKQRNLSSEGVHTRWLLKANPRRPARRWARGGMQTE